MTSEDREPAAGGIGHNEPPVVSESFVALETKAQAHANVASEWIEKTNPELVTKSEAERINDVLRTLQAVEKEVEQARVKDKEPHLAAGRAVDEAYGRLKRPLQAAVAGMKKLLTVYVRRQAEEAERQAREEAEAAAAERARAEEEAEAARRRGDLFGADEAEQRKAAAEQAQARAEAPRKSSVGSASGGARTGSMIETPVVEIENERKAFSALIDEFRTEIVELLAKLATRRARSLRARGQPLKISGVKIELRKEYR